MAMSKRRDISQLNGRDFSLYRAICRELEELQCVIKEKSVEFPDFEEISVAMMDRRFLVEWLRELDFPTVMAYVDCGLDEAAEDRILLDPPV
jgi:hypothetical protein